MRFPLNFNAMSFKFTSYIFAFIAVFSNVFLKAQKAFTDFSKEKTYIQTNHVFYKPGEEMFFKVYVVNAENNLPTQQSKVVNFELIDPSGSIVKKESLEIKNGYAEGYFYFANDMKGGIYKIKSYTNWMLNETGKNIFEKEIMLQKIVSPRILMKLDFPKKGYGAGDEVLADFSMKSLGNSPIPFYEAEYTVMHEGEKIAAGKLITDNEGKFLLKFPLPTILKSADALLTIKVNFDGFTESISRNIPIVLNKLDLKFMPEGGTFINGMEQNIAYKISDEFEKPVDAILEIFNNENEKVTETSAYNFGMGSFLFTPKNGETYFAKVLKPENISQIFELPLPKNEGIVLNIEKKNEEIKFKINSTVQKTISIKGTFREKEIYTNNLSIQQGINQFSLSEKDLPIGICRFTIFENEIPLAERIVFTNENKQLNIKIKPVKKNYLPREKVVVNIETTDENNSPIPANLGISVIDDKLWTYADDKQNHISSWLLLDSELSGKIERPQFYFDKKEQKATKSLDLVMLTNGYRYFELIPEVIKNKKYKYLPEQKNPIYGIVEDENKRPVKAEVYLVQKNKILQQTTSENGLFYFKDLDNSSTNTLIAKSLQPKQKVKIRMLAYQLNINPLEKQNLKNIDVEEIIKEVEIKEKPKEDIPKKNNQQLYNNRSTSDTIKTQNVESVVLQGYSIKNKQTAFSIEYLVENRSNISFLNSMQGEAAGLSINSTSGAPGSSKQDVIIRGVGSINSNAEPLYVVDGIISNATQFRSLNPNEINNVAVLKDAAATSIYGNRGSNGVIVINTKNNKSSNLKLDITPKSYYDVYNIPHDSLKSFSYERNFSYPVYTSTNTKYRHDYRENIYWNPVVETNSKGQAQIEFYNSDANTTFRILTEGISAKGLVGRDESTYAAQSLISIDAKIPQYLTRTDTMLIPVVVKNNSPETRTMSMEVVVPNHIRLLKSDSIITLKPLESGRLFVEMQTDHTINSNIQFRIKSGEFSETMILPFKVEEKGFLHQFSVLNNKDEVLKIEIPEMIAGSFNSSYTVFENSALQMFEDLERLKKEPYGCFEQLSSTVYPNVFILDYLKSSKKITQATEFEVANNLKKGFQKMLSYKNRDGGFGYFSSSESDVALSAFALLEFTALKKYVTIEPKILANLSSFILSKKNVNGIFEVRKDYEGRRTFSEYSWSRNMYVLYALSKVGIKTELENTYKVSLARVLATKDSYQLALMANTAQNLGKTEDRDILLQILNQQYDSKNVKISSTFTGSAGTSAQSETLALYVMALQSDEKTNQHQIAKVASELMENNGYYGYGSTQATALALEALSTFFAKNEALFGTEKPQIKINSTLVLPNLSIGSAFKVGENEVSINYPSSKGLPYKLDYQYYTVQAPASSEIPITLETKLKNEISKVGETNRMSVTIKNKINGQLPMVTAKIGIPAGLTLQNSLLKDLIDKKQISYYEIFDNYLVLYWEHLDANETKTINLDLKVEFAGDYTGKASNVYLYYMPEAKFWNEGIKAKINY